MRNSYLIRGLILALAGVILSLVAYFLFHWVPLTAAGISAVIIGGSAVALGFSRPCISPETCLLLFKTGEKITEALFHEEKNAGKAIYIPSNDSNHNVKVIIPLDGEISSGKLKTALPEGLFIHDDDNKIVAISMITPGSIAAENLDLEIEPDLDQLENTLTRVLAGMYDLADSAKIQMGNDCIIVEVSHPQFHTTNMRYYLITGSPVASITAAIVCKAVGKPVRIKEEKYEKRKLTVTLGLGDKP
jgi:hypothetical protein